LPYRLDFGDTVDENEVISMIATTPSHLELLDAIEHLPPGGVLSFEDMPWREYEKLLEALGDNSNVRISYDSGSLAIISPSDWHDYYKTLLGHLVGVLTEELDIECASFGSTTFRKEEEAKGTEPDDCFYITNVGRVIGKPGLDLDRDPPPDLAIEVDISHQSKIKFPIYAALGVPEIWRYRKGKIYFYRLSGQNYVEIQASDLFPFLTPPALESFLDQDYIQGFNEVKRKFRKWVQANK
jgi:Uma2 family endonuclease